MSGGPEKSTEKDTASPSGGSKSPQEQPAEKIGNIFNEAKPPADISQAELQYWESLMRDPAHGNKITTQSMEEALAGIAAEKQGFLAGPLKRDPTPAAEFIDKFAQAWDVKAAISKAPNGKHIFNPTQLLQSIKRDLSIGENIILDLRRLDNSDMPLLYEKIRTSLTPQDIKRIIVVLKNETLKSLT